MKKFKKIPAQLISIPSLLKTICTHLVSIGRKVFPEQECIGSGEAGVGASHARQAEEVPKVGRKSLLTHVFIRVCSRVHMVRGQWLFFSLHVLYCDLHDTPLS